MIDFADRVCDVILQLFAMFNDSRANNTTISDGNPRSGGGGADLMASPGGGAAAPADVDELAVLQRVMRVAQVGVRRSNQSFEQFL